MPSITKIVTYKKIKEKFNDWFAKPTFPYKAPILHPPITTNYALVGTAFDYLLRFMIKQANPSAFEQKWVAEIALEELYLRSQITGYEPEENKPQINAWIKETKPLLDLARQNYEKFLQTGEITTDLLRSCLHLAKIDAFRRASYVRGKIDEINLGDVKDLQSLSSNIPFDRFRVLEICLLNPTFNDSFKVAGITADADLVLDNTLVDIKTVQALRLDRKVFDQLMGYLLLSKALGIKQAPKTHQITKLGVYFSRHQYFYTFNLEDVLKVKDLDLIAKEFIEICREISREET